MMFWPYCERPKATAVYGRTTGSVTVPGCNRSRSFKRPAPSATELERVANDEATERYVARNGSSTRLGIDGA